MSKPAGNALANTGIPGNCACLAEENLDLVLSCLSFCASYARRKRMAHAVNQMLIELLQADLSKDNADIGSARADLAHGKANPASNRALQPNARPFKALGQARASFELELIRQESL